MESNVTYMLSCSWLVMHEFEELLDSRLFIVLKHLYYPFALFDFPVVMEPCDPIDRNRRTRGMSGKAI